MNKVIVPLLLVAVAALLGAAGCSSDQPGAPAGGSTALWRADKTTGPSEIVLAIDVSDAVSDDQLSALVAGVLTGLAYGDVVPADGSIAVGAYVFGDTIAAPFAGLVAVTPENIENIISPALSGLTADRLVTGGATKLADALTAAGDLLATAGQVSDQHVLALGSGAAADTLAVGDACAALGAAGVMISGVAFGEGAPLASCADATGGWFAGEVADAAAAVVDAMAYMLLADLDLTGSAAELGLGDEFTATAAFYRGGDADAYPLAGYDVTFAVIEGPNAGDPVTAATDTLGHAVLVYTGDGGPGTDVVVAQAAHPGTGLALSDTVSVTWLNTPPVCDAGGPYLAVVDADTVYVQLDASASSDADGDTLTFAWTVEFDGASFDDAALAAPKLMLTGAALCADSLVVHVEVSDGYDASACEAVITLDEQRPPVVEVIDEPLRLWPPNHKYATFTPDMFIVAATDACGEPIDLSGVAVVAVDSDEPDDANGDGRTCNDIVIGCPDRVDLRAERMGGGDGRVYTIHYRLTDADGNAVDFTGQVVVPHDDSGRPAGEDPMGGFTVTAECGDDG